MVFAVAFLCNALTRPRSTVGACNLELVTWNSRRSTKDGKERWPSGRRRSPAKRVGGLKLPRGFKSLPLRPNMRRISARIASAPGEEVAYQGRRSVDLVESQAALK